MEGEEEEVEKRGRRRRRGEEMGRRRKLLRHKNSYRSDLRITKLGTFEEIVTY